MFKPTTLAAATLTAFAALPALADGLTLPVDPAPLVAAPTPASTPWTGLWVGVSLGNAFANYDISTTVASREDPTNYGRLDMPDFGGRGETFGLQLGYNHQFNQKGVWGVELRADQAHVQTGVALMAGAEGGSGTLGSYDYEVTESAAILGKIGYVVQEKTMVYGIFGLTRSTGTATLASDIGAFSASADLELVGATFGIGIETMITQNLSFKIDYAITEYNRHAYFENQPFLRDSNISADLATNAQAVHAALALHF